MFLLDFDIHDHVLLILMNNMIASIKTWNTPVTSRWNRSSLLHFPTHPYILTRAAMPKAAAASSQDLILFIKSSATFAPHCHNSHGVYM